MEAVYNTETHETSRLNAYEGLVDEYGEGVYKFCRSLTYSKEDGEDLFQETFLKVLEQLDEILISENPKSFIFSISLFTWKSWKRKYARRNRLAPMVPQQQSQVLESEINLENSFIEDEENRVIRQLVESLPEKLRIPVTMYYTIEASIADIGLTLGIPSGTVKSRLYKARKLIEKGLIKYNNEK